MIYLYILHIYIYDVIITPFVRSPRSSFSFCRMTQEREVQLNDKHNARFSIQIQRTDQST